MATTLSLIITDAGIAEVINAQHDGTAPVVLTQVGFGRGIYTPVPSQTELHDEIKRVSTISGGVVGDNIMHIQALDGDASAAYAVYEIGVYTASGTLFAVYSQPLPIIHKVADSEIMIAIDIILTGVEPTAVTVGNTNYTLAPATTSNLGVVELATNEEAVTGTDTERALTPASGAAAYVSLSKNQTIAGQKTFSDGITGNVTGNLAGLIPYATFAPSPSVPVGSILLILIERKASVSSAVTLYWGETVSNAGGDYEVYSVKLSLDSNGNVRATDAGGTYAGTFALMSTVTFSAQWEKCPALAIKIANA